MDEKHKAIDLLCNAPKWCTYKRIEEDTGIPVGWLTRLKLGKIKRPNQERLTKLLTFLDNVNIGNYTEHR